MGLQVIAPSPNTYALLTRTRQDSFIGGRKWAIVGASITNGSSSTNGSTDSFAAMLGKIAGMQYVRKYSELILAGVPGETSTQIAARTAAQIANGAQGLIIPPDFGTNSADTISISQFKTDFQAMVGYARAAGIPVVACTTLPRSSSASAALKDGIRLRNLYIRLWCSQNGVPVADCHDALVDTTTGYLSATYDSGDGTHPNDLGHTLIASTIAAVIAPTAAAASPLVTALAWPGKWGPPSGDVTVDPTTGVHLLRNPLMHTSGGWSNRSTTGTAAITATWDVAPTGGDGLPGGSWFSIRVNNAGQGTSASRVYGALIPSGLASSGDLILVMCRLKSSDANSLGIKFGITTNDVFSTTFADVPSSGSARLLTAPTSIMGTFTYPASGSIRVAIQQGVVAGADITAYLGACQAFNLTTGGLTEFA